MAEAAGSLSPPSGWECASRPRVTPDVSMSSNKTKFLFVFKINEKSFVSFSNIIGIKSKQITGKMR